MKKAFILFTLTLGSLLTVACSDFDLAAVTVEITPRATSASYASPFVRVSEFNSFFVKFDLTGEGASKFTTWFEITDGSGQLEQQEVEIECENSKCSGFAISSPSRAYKFQIELTGEAGQRADNFEIETKSISTQSSWQLIPSASAQITDLPIISREEWGANSDYLLKRDIKTSVQTGGKRQQQCDEWVRDFPGEFQTDGRKITVDTQNRELQFPRTYSKAIRKIVIHSTATDEDKDVNGDKKFTPEDTEAITRAIYYYHAMWKGWGDIGYHYLIDPFGNIYEGRSGGDYVVGAHAYCANTGTIGVAFIGDFGETLPSRPAFVSAEQLLGELANLYSLDLAVSSSWHGKLIRNLVGHRDYVATECPGDELYAYLGDLAQSAMNHARGNLLSNVDFDYHMIASDSPIFLDPLEEKALTFKLKNVGKKAWPAGSKLRLSRSEIRKNGFGATVGDGSEFAVSLNSQVSAGATATVRIPVAAKMQAGRYRFGITPSFGGQDARKFYVVVNVNEAKLDYELLSAKHPPQPFAPGAQAIAFVELRNKSNFTWKAQGEHRVYLGTTKPLNRASPFRLGTTHELGGLDQDIPPGGIAQFTLNLTAPQRAARYEITFAPAVAGFGYLPDYDMQFHTTVREPRFSADLLDVSSGPDLRFEPGETRELSLSFLNTSQVDWNADQFELEVLQNSGVAISRQSLRLPDKVSENEQVRIGFNVTAPVRQGKYRFTLRPKWENGKVKTLKPVDFLIEVNPPRLTGELSPKPETLTLANGGEEKISLTYKNTGNVTWQQSDVILQRLPARASALVAGNWLSSLQPAKLKEDSVQPGAVGHFEFTVRKNSESSREIESFVPIVRGLGRIRGPAAKIEVQNANLTIA
ncbi:MAG: N-acetylmuramoyl-L-alanine amidase, partial [Patescibacteria group bacterium]